VTDPLLALLDRSRSLGFLGPGPVDEHLQHALAFAATVAEPPARALDLGAGGGLPGLVLAARTWPSTQWTFLDAQRKRTDFLEAAVHELGLADRVEVVTKRAEVVGRAPAHRGGYDLVVSRSFGPPAVTAECAAPFLRPGGRLVVSEPPTGSTGRWPGDGLAQVGLRAEGPVEHDQVHLMVLVRTDDPIDRLPRRPGLPAKRPLFTS
jgi:16S rRNA (guanine527-N7)-methyltransferase